MQMRAPGKLYAFVCRSNIDAHEPMCTVYVPVRTRCTVYVAVRTLDSHSEDYASHASKPSNRRGGETWGERDGESVRRKATDGDGRVKKQGGMMKGD
jgi:hypothetical protein